MNISPLIRFGTSTWTYEGWQGPVYQQSTWWKILRNL